MGCKKGGGGKKKIWLLGVLLSIAAVFIPLQSVQAEQTTLVTSAVGRTTSYISNDIVKGSIYRGVHVNFIVTAASSVSGTSLTVAIDAKDPGGNYYNLLTGAAISNVTGTTTYRIYPGLSSVSNSIANDVIPDAWRIKVTHGGPASNTYVLNYNTLP